MAEHENEGRVSESRPSTASATALHAHRYKSGECIIAGCEAIYDKDRWYVPDWNQTEDPPVSAPSTALETADETAFLDEPCAKCGRTWRQDGPGGNKRGSSYARYHWHRMKHGHGFERPVEEPVSPPSPDARCAVEHCGHRRDQHDVYGCLGTAGGCKSPSLAHHHFTEPVALPPQEGDGWKRQGGESWSHMTWVEMVDGRPMRSVAVPLAVEEAIRAEADRATAAYVRGIERRILVVDERNDRLQTALEHAENALEEIANVDHVGLRTSGRSVGDWAVARARRAAHEDTNA